MSWFRIRASFRSQLTYSHIWSYEKYHILGIHNSTGCKDAGILPVFVSLPHFLDADPSYLKQFQPGSLNPDPEQHSAYMILQPDTSIPVQVKMRLQIILQVGQVSLYDSTSLWPNSSFRRFYYIFIKCYSIVRCVQRFLISKCFEFFDW